VVLFDGRDKVCGLKIKNKLPHALLKTRAASEAPLPWKLLTVKHLKVPARPKLYSFGDWRQAKIEEIVTGL